MEIILEIDPEFSLMIDAQQLRQAVETTLKIIQAEVLPTQSVAVSITDNPTITGLNRQYRGIDAPTDVLSFVNEPDPDFIGLDPEIDTHLGDVIIAYPVAEAQANASGHAPMAEVMLLAVHGTLHLLGFDHDTAAAQAAMWSAQSRVLAELGLTGIHPTEE
jgi:probable rRNA maturation factor